MSNIRRKQSSKKRSWVQITIISIIILAFLAVIIALISSFFFNPERTVRADIDSLVSDYYEDFIYKTTDELNKGNASNALSKYSEIGLSIVTLRQIILHNDGRFTDKTALIEQYCDTSHTTIKYYPQEPYGKTDYRTEINYSCNF